MIKRIPLKKTVILAVVLLLAVFAVATIVSIQFEINDMKEQKEALEAQKAALLAENEKMEHDISMPVGDEYIIAIMRKLGYRFPDEEKITFDSEQTGEGEQ